MLAGDNIFSLSIEDLGLSYGDYWFSIQATDTLKRKSMKLYFDFRIYDKENYDNSINNNCYEISENELISYNINRLDHPDYKHILVPIPPNTDDIYRYLELYSENYNISDEDYICFIADTNDDGIFDFKQNNWFHWTDGDFISYIKYSDKYNKELIEEKALKTTTGLRTLIQDKINEGYKKIIMPYGFYRVSTKDVIEIAGENIIIDFSNSLIKSNRLNLPCNNIINLYGYNAKVINCNFEGCLFETDYSEFATDEDPGAVKHYEQGHGISICGDSKYSAFENCNVKNFNGYGVISSSPIYVENPYKGNYWNDYSGYRLLSDSSKWITGDINSNGEYIKSDSRLVYNEYFDISHITENFMTFAKYLGYGGILGGSPYLECHMYDANFNYLGSEVSMQFRRILLKKDTKYIKLVVYSNIFSREKNNVIFSLDQLACVSYLLPRNCYLDNINISNIRCVGFTPFGNNCYMSNSSITHSGFALAHQLVDAEDYWERLQDFTFINCTINNGITNSYLLLCSGINTVVDNCDIEFSQYGSARDTVIRNCNISALDIGNYGLYFTGYSRLYNNTINNTGAYNAFFGSIGSRDYNITPHDKQIVINNTNTFIGCNWVASKNRDVLVKKISFNFKDRIPQSNGTILADYYECELNNLNGKITNAHLSKCILNDCNIEITNTFNGYYYENLFIECIFNNCTYINKTNLSDDELFKKCKFN